MAITTKIRNLTNTATEPSSDDYIVVDGNTSGTRKMLVSNINKTSNIYYLSDYIKDVDVNNDENIKSLISEINANQNNVKVIFNIPKLKVSKPFYIHRGNIEIDFNDCNIIWENYNSVGANSGE